MKNCTSAFFKISAVAAQILSAAIFLYPAGYAMDTRSQPLNVHAQITHDALSGTISESNLKLIMDADAAQDAPGSEGSSEKRRHFDGATLAQSFSHINREKNRALTLAAEADREPQARLDALRHLGVMLHSVQDFYLRTNYVDQQLNDEANRNDPYNIAMVDWTKITDAPVLKGAKHGDGNDPLNKDSATAGGGKTPIVGKANFHSVAVDLAVRETQRQWNLFETLLRNRCGERAPAVIAAMRQANTPTTNQNSAAHEKESGQTIVGDPTKPVPDSLKMDDRNSDLPDPNDGP